jgi:hypothetical protein
MINQIVHKSKDFFSILVQKSICNTRVLAKDFSNRPSKGRTIFPRKKSATVKIVDMFRSQIKKNSSEARVKMHKYISFAARWWSLLMR